jgi:hypothetical protein
MTKATMSIFKTYAESCFGRVNPNLFNAMTQQLGLLSMEAAAMQGTHRVNRKGKVPNQDYAESFESILYEQQENLIDELGQGGSTSAHMWGAKSSRQ